MAAVTDRWLLALQALLPPGNALSRDPDALLTKLLGALAANFAHAQASAEDLRQQSSDPSIATDMLSNWEALLGLPDSCTANQTLSLLDRQRIAAQRLVEQGGQSRAYFIDLAARLGEPNCTIDEFAPATCNSNCSSSLYSQADRFVWRLNIPHAAANLRQMNCNDDCNTGLQFYKPSLIECPVRKRKAAHTTVIFSYTG